MDFLLNRYRNLTVLLIVVLMQLLLLAYQVKTNKDVPLMRVWAVSAVTPIEEGLEWTRRHTIGFVEDYFVLVHVREQNAQLQHDLDRMKLENHYLRNELSTADRVKLLNTFREETPSKTLAARTIGNGTGAANSKTIFVDRGITAGVENGMAAITPDGIVGKVVATYPTASLIMLMTDPSFAAGVISQNNHVHGTLKGQGGPKCRVEYVQNEEKVDVGEYFYTSGDDGIFPRGFPAGQVASVTNGRTTKEIVITPSGWQGGLDEVLIVTEGVHQPIPAPKVASTPVKILPPPSDQTTAGTSQQNTAALATDADKLRQEYKQVGVDEKIQFGDAGKPPDFTKIGRTTPLPQTPQSGQQQQPLAMQPPPNSGTSRPGGTTATGAAPLTPSNTSGLGGAAMKPQVPPTTATTTLRTPVTAVISPPNPAPIPKQRRPAPILETDPTDADPANEAVAERAQRERSNAKIVSEDKNTEVLPSTPAPKTKPAAPKSTAPKTPSATSGVPKSGPSAQ